METKANDEFNRHTYMPHELLMEELGIKYSDLTYDIKEDIELYISLHKKSLEDGFISDDEEKELIQLSQKILKSIKLEIKNKRLKVGDDGSDTILGVLGGVVLGIGGYFGFKTLIK